MPFPPGAQNLRIDSPAVIADQEAKVISSILEHSLYGRSVRMTEHIRKCFSAYTINFVAHNRPERARRALDDYTIFDVPGSSEIARYLGQRAFQILFLGA